MIANKNNFYMTTKANFEAIEVPNIEPDYISGSGSEYWYSKNGVIRFSNHWDEVSSCTWTIDNGFCGYCDFKDFHHKSLSVTVYKTSTEYYNIQTSFSNCKDGLIHHKNACCDLTPCFHMAIFLYDFYGKLKIQ